MFKITKTPKLMNNAEEIVEAGGKALVKELVRLLPLGSTAVEIFDEFQSKQIKRKIQRLEEFYGNLAASVNAVSDRVNQEFVSKDDFLDVFEEATHYVVLERHENKRLFFKNILVNSIISLDCDYDKTERYFRLLDVLTEIELRILAVLDNPDSYNKSHGMIIKDSIHNAYQTTWIRVTGSGILTQLLGIKIHDIEDAIAVLFSNGLIVANVLEKSLETNSNPIHVLDNLLTTRGRDFVNYLNG